MPLRLQNLVVDFPLNRVFRHRAKPHFVMPPILVAFTLVIQNQLGQVQLAPALVVGRNHGACVRVSSVAELLPAPPALLLNRNQLVVHFCFSLLPQLLPSSLKPAALTQRLSCRDSAYLFEAAPLNFLTKDILQRIGNNSLHPTNERTIVSVRQLSRSRRECARQELAEG